MNRLILTLLPLLISIASFAQKQDSILFNGATKILIRNQLTAEDNYNLAAQTLLDQGYIIEKSDKEFFQLQTSSIPVYGEGVTKMFSLYVLSRKNNIVIVGRTKNKEGLKIINIPTDTDNYEVIPYKKSRLLSKNIFAKLDEFAKKLNGTITYSE